MDLNWYASHIKSIYGKLDSRTNMKTATSSGLNERSSKGTREATSPQKATSKAKKAFLDLPLEVSYEYFYFGETFTYEGSAPYDLPLRAHSKKTSASTS